MRCATRRDERAGHERCAVQYPGLRSIHTEVAGMKAPHGKPPRCDVNGASGPSAPNRPGAVRQGVTAGVIREDDGSD